MNWVVDMSLSPAFGDLVEHPERYERRPRAAVTRKWKREWNLPRRHGTIGGMEARDVLLATKLHVPRPRPDFVARPRLATRLDEGLGRDLILVCAPAGFGKSSQLASWASAGRHPVAWLSLDSGDNDPARFWRHVAAALERACPGIGDRVRPLLEPLPPQSFESVVTALINELAGQPAGGLALLVLDDYHLIDAEPVHTGMQFLLDHLPPGLRVVLSTRSDPPLRLSRLRARGGLAELRAADLRFTPEEAGALLRATPGLTDAAVAALTGRTEGWAAGLKLAGLSLSGRGDVAAFVTDFSGSNRHVLDYLAEEVLDRQDAGLRRFLLETSLLDRLSGDLCDAVTGRRGSQEMLERIEHEGLFLLPLDDAREWWRYHQLFADLLRARLRAELPDRVVALHSAASGWHAEHGLPDDAVTHALAAEERERAANFIERYFDAVFFTGENATMQRWLTALPADLMSSRPRLSLARAFMALTHGDPVAAQAAIAHLGAEQDTAGDAFSPSVGQGASLIANVPASTAIARGWLAYLHGDVGQMTECADRARDRLRDGEELLASTYRLNRALADWLGGRLDAAGQWYTACIARWRATGQQALAAQGCNHLAQIRIAQGNLAGALDAYGELLQITAPPGRPPSPVAGVGRVGRAAVRYQRGDLAAARTDLTDGLPPCRQLSETLTLAAGLTTLAWIRQAEGDQAGAREAIRDAERAGPSPIVASLLNPVPAERARLLLAQGDLDAAAAWTVERGLRPDGEPSYPSERDYLVLARVLLAQDRSGPALGLLDRLRATAESQGRTGSVIEIRALRALALGRGGDEPSAMAELAAALALAAPRGHVRVFADEGEPMTALLSRLLAAHRDGQPPARQVPLGHLAAVLRSCAPAADPSGAGHSVPGLIEPLTARETQVLELLAVGLANQRIANDLVVSLDTVKKHVTHVLGKLGAANRTEAVTRARQLGLIS
jgi:LuxR family transcriptional regulator, maltose regulon positive regulatory protein